MDIAGTVEPISLQSQRCRDTSFLYLNSSITSDAGYNRYTHPFVRGHNSTQSNSVWTFGKDQQKRQSTRICCSDGTDSSGTSSIAEHSTENWAKIINDKKKYQYYDLYRIWPNLHRKTGKKFILFKIKKIGL